MGPYCFVARYLQNGDEMSIDGADMGVKPQRALKSILGGEDQPQKDDCLTPEEMRREIMMQPDNYKDRENTYDGCAMWLAKQFLLLLESGFEGTYSTLYDEMEKRNPHQDYDFTGFMVGWANNAARYCLKKSSQNNPAIMEI